MRFSADYAARGSNVSAELDAPTWAALGYITSGIVGAGTIVAGFVFRLWQMFSARDKDLDDFKLEVARNYVTSQALLQAEQRLVNAMDRLSDRIERILDHRNR
jgi:hypothetical protein